MRPATAIGSNWIEPQTTEDLEHGVRSSLERARRSERVARDEKATCGLGSDLHESPLVQVQLVEQRVGVVDALKQVLVVLDHLAAHVDPNHCLYTNAS